MLWPLTITCIDESGNRLPGAAIQVRDNLNPSLSVDAYDSDYQLVASPVAGPTGMATVFLRNGYIDSRYVLDPYESEWITDLALAPSGRPGRWRDDVGGTIAAGATTDFTITVPNLGIEKGTENVVVSVDMTHPHMEDLTLQLVRTGIPVDLGGPEIVTHLLHEHIEPQAFSGVVTFEHVPGGLLPEQGDRQLLDAVSSTDTTFDINQAIGTDWPAPTYLRIGSEIVQVTAGATTTSPTVARGQLGTTAAAHDPAVDPATLTALWHLTDGITVPPDTVAADPVGPWQLAGTRLNDNAEGDWLLRAIDAGTAGGTVNNWTLTSPANLSFT
jgi:hypothetical protein